LLLRFFDQMMHFMGLLSEPLVAGCLVLAADTAHKSWLGSRPQASPQ